MSNVPAGEPTPSSATPKTDLDAVALLAQYVADRFREGYLVAHYMSLCNVLERAGCSDGRKVSDLTEKAMNELYRRGLVEPLLDARRLWPVNWRILPAATHSHVPPVTGQSEPVAALLRLFTNGVADDRIQQAAQIVASTQLSVGEKLEAIHRLLPIPPTASAQDIASALGVSKQAILKTEWWIQNRKSEKENEVGRRRNWHRERAKYAKDDNE